MTGTVLFAALLTFVSVFQTQGEISGSYNVSWRVVYTDSTHTMTIADTEEGTCLNGTGIYVGFPSTVYVGTEIWETSETPGKRVINGPGLEIIYVIYEHTGDLPEPEDPDAEAKEALAEWIQKGKEAESALTGKSAEDIPDNALICAEEGTSRMRLLSAAAYITDGSLHDVYIIAKDCIPTGICLKEAYGISIIYSNDEKEVLEIGGSTYRVTCFKIRKVYDTTCFHRWDTITDLEPTCLSRGVTRLRCSLCGTVSTTCHAALPHVDEGGDGTCDVCGQPTLTPPAAAHWYLGDAITETVGDKSYSFRCIDEDYCDISGNHTGSALFLCDTIIDPTEGGRYVLEPDGTGKQIYVWHPGPIAYFGENNNFKKSKIKAFLDASSVQSAKSSAIGVPTAYAGAAETGKYSAMTDAGLKSYSIGYQQMSCNLFILSVEEALQYKDFLWKFNGSTTDNPDTITGGTLTGYWLRTPNGTNNDYDETDMVYEVDLNRGNIHPTYIKPQSSTGDPFADTQTTVGIRPAFTIPNY